MYRRLSIFVLLSLVAPFAAQSAQEHSSAQTKKQKDGVRPYPWVRAWIALQWLKATGLLGHTDGGGKPLEIVELKKKTKGRAGRSSARTWPERSFQVNLGHGKNRIW